MVDSRRILTEPSAMSTDTTASEKLSAQVIDEIFALMGRRRINKAEMARRLGKSEVWVGRRLNGKLPLAVDDLQHIAVVLGVAASDLLPRKRDSVYKPTHDLDAVLDPFVDGIQARVVATVGEPRHRKASPVRTHQPGRPVTQTRPLSPVSR